jgi:hypothetical protein
MLRRPAIGKILPAVTRRILAFDPQMLTSLPFLEAAPPSLPNSSKVKKLYFALSAVRFVYTFLLTNFWTGSRNEKARAAPTIFSSFDKRPSNTPFSSRSFAIALMVSLPSGDWSAKKALQAVLNLVLSV